MIFCNAKPKLWALGIASTKSKTHEPQSYKTWQNSCLRSLGYDKYYEIALEMERVVAEKLGGKGIYPNVDFYSGLVYRKMGIPTDLFTPIFAIARVAGWLAHWKEQLAENRIFRPTQVYNGLHEIAYTPIDTTLTGN